MVRLAKPELDELELLEELLELDELAGGLEEPLDEPQPVETARVSIRQANGA